MNINEVMNDCFGTISAAHVNFPIGDGKLVSTGFDDLDLALDGGLEKGSLYLLKGRPESGKTNLAVDLICNCAEKGFNTALFSLQEENEMIAQKMLSYKSGIPYGLIRAGLLTDMQVNIVSLSAHNLGDMSIDISDGFRDLSDIGNRMAQLKTGDGLEVAVIDCLELLKYKKRGFGEEELLRRIKLLADQLDTAIVVVSQIPEGRQFRNMITMDICTKHYADKHLLNKPVVDAVIYLQNEVYGSAGHKVKYDADLLIYSDKNEFPVSVDLAYRPALVRYDSI